MPHLKTYFPLSDVRSTRPARACAAIGRYLASFSRIMTRRAYVTDISLAGVPAHAPSMLLDTIRVGPNTCMGVSRACDEAMAAPSSVSQALLDTFLRGVTFLATEDLDEFLANKENRQCHFKKYRALDRHGYSTHNGSRRYMWIYCSISFKMALLIRLICQDLV